MKGLGIYSLVLVLGFLVADTTAEPIWHWVDESGREVYSNLKPPAQARDLTVVESRWAADQSRLPSTTRPHEVVRSENRRLIDAYDMLLDELYDLRGHVDDLRRDLSGPRHVLYTPEADYAYSRRYYHGPRRNQGKGIRSGLRQYSKPHPFGQRQYDRHYFSNAYRYRSSLPHYGASRVPPGSR